VIHVGTPPPSHLSLALEALDETPRALVIEKPACPPSLEHAAALQAKAVRSGARVLVGYDHVVGRAARIVSDLVARGTLGQPTTLDVEFREHWGGIFAAHPWLAGVEDTYLGSWEQGGGASGEHSHAANLWQHLSHKLGCGRVIEVEGMLTYVRDGKAAYDNVCALHLRTERGLGGTVVQDVVTRPARKRARIQGSEGALEWIGGYDAEADAVVRVDHDGSAETQRIAKTRPDDFIEELRYVEATLSGSETGEDLSLERGLDTMLVIAAAHLSERERRRIHIDHKRGYVLEALS
jgi:predicted dehydrogenase